MKNSKPIVNFEIAQISSGECLVTFKDSRFASDKFDHLSDSHSGGKPMGVHDQVRADTYHAQ
jgi:hypothetical protein